MRSSRLSIPCDAAPAPPGRAHAAGLSAARLADDDRDRPALRIELIHVVSVAHGHESRPRSRSLLTGRDPGPNTAHGGTDLHGRLGIGSEVVKASGVLRVAGPRGNDGEIGSVLDAHQR